jgi:hypothetical protein
VTFIPQDVTLTFGDHRVVVRFVIQGQEVSVELGESNSACRRCRKPLFGSRLISLIWPLVTRKHHPPTPGKMVYWTGPDFRYGPLQPTPHYRVAFYHERCLPPNVRAALPGRSRLAPADADPSLREQHGSALAGQRTGEDVCGHCGHVYRHDQAVCLCGAARVHPLPVRG